MRLAILSIVALGFAVACTPTSTEPPKAGAEADARPLNVEQLMGAPWRVVSVNGKPPHPADRGWKDTVAVYPNETVVVMPYFDYFPGRYVFHCHAAEHGDMSMMGQMEVVA